MKNINLQSGRSMIEMLGVLAIIGVLSVGGIAGYSKAMFRYKINKTIEQITYIAANIRTTFANQGNYAGLTASCPAGQTCIAKKAHIFPDDMWKDGETSPQSVWEGRVTLGPTHKNSADTNRNKAFVVGYDDIPEEEACIELITHDWNNAQAKIIGVFNFSFFYVLPPPAKMEDALIVCDNMEYGSVFFYFDIDTSDSLWKDQIDETTAALSGL